MPQQQPTINQHLTSTYAMKGFKQNLKQELIAQTKRRLIEESVPRIKKCLAQLSETEIWHRPNEQTVSIGNLVLHLCGNVRQWILTGIGQYEDARMRQQEFDETGPISTKKLLQDLDMLMVEVEAVLDNLDVEILLEAQTIQGFQESGLAIILHVVEHFSYHTGQITYAVKAAKNIDMGYYAGLDLDVTE